MDLQENKPQEYIVPDVIIQYEPQCIDVTGNPIIIVGMCPGRVRNSVEKRIAWHGNRSADLLESAIKGVKNIILTNITNTFTTGALTKDMIRTGLDDLSQLFIKHDPKLVIFVGAFAQKHGSSILHGTRSASINHPSFVLRFSKDQTWWKKKMRNIVAVKA